MAADSPTDWPAVVQILAPVFGGIALVVSVLALRVRRTAGRAAATEAIMDAFDEVVGLALSSDSNLASFDRGFFGELGRGLDDARDMWIAYGVLNTLERVFVHWRRGLASDEYAIPLLHRLLKGCLTEQSVRNALRDGGYDRRFTEFATLTFTTPTVRPPVRVPTRALPHVLLESTKGSFRARSRRPMTRADEVRAMNFFRTRSLSNDFKDFTDARTSWYLGPLAKSPRLTKLLQPHPDIVDLGCGDGGLLRWLKRANRIIDDASYLGIDQDDLAIERARAAFPEASFEVADLRAPNTSIVQKDSVVFAVNLLPYLLAPEEVLGWVNQQTSAAAHLCVLDPIPSRYWEDEFEGVMISVRWPGLIDAIALCAGWQLVEATTAGVLPFFRGRCLGKMWTLRIYESLT